MATTPTPISDLPATTALADDDLVIVQKANGNTSKMTGAKLKEIVTPPASTWSGTTGKPFDEVGSGLNISLSGSTKKLNANAPSWASVTEKPFSSVGNGLTVENDQLKAAQTWSGTTGKPFSSVEQGLGLSIVDGVLKSTVPTFEPYYATYGETSYSNILSAFATGKPVYLLDNNDGTLFATYKVYGNQISFCAPVRSGGTDYLSIRSVNVGNQWSTRNVPLTGGGGSGGEQSVIIYQYGDTITFEDIIASIESGKVILMFDTVGSDLENANINIYNLNGINISEELNELNLYFSSGTDTAIYDILDNRWGKESKRYVAFPGLPPVNGAVPTYDSTFDTTFWRVPSVGSAAWSAVTDKPFSSIGSGLSVSGGVLSATGGGGGASTWNDISGKPFSTVNTESGLTLNSNQLSLDSTVKSGAAAGATAVQKSAQATKTSAMTQAVGIDSNGKLWTAPSGGGGGGQYIAQYGSTTIEDISSAYSAGYDIILSLPTAGVVIDGRAYTGTQYSYAVADGEAAEFLLLASGRESLMMSPDRFAVIYVTCDADGWSSSVYKQLVTSVNGDVGDVTVSGGGGGDDVFIINVTQSGSTYTPDKTYSEASTAYDAGKILIMRINQGEYYAKSKYSQGISFGNGAELFEGAISTKSYTFNTNGTVTLYEEGASFNDVVSKPTSGTPSGYVPTSNGSGGYSWQAQQGGGGGGTSDHSQLTNRDAANQHPISAINGLQTALDGKQATISDLTTIRTGASAGAGSVQKSAQASKTSDMTQAVGIDSNGKLWTAPSGGGGGGDVTYSITPTTVSFTHNSYVTLGITISADGTITASKTSGGGTVSRPVITMYSETYSASNVITKIPIPQSEGVHTDTLTVWWGQNTSWTTPSDSTNSSSNAPLTITYTVVATGGGGGGVTPDLVVTATATENVGTSEGYTYTKVSGSVSAVCNKIRNNEKPLVIVRALPHIDSAFRPTVVEATVSAYLNNSAPTAEFIDLCWLRVFNDAPSGTEKAKYFTTVLNYNF